MTGFPGWALPLLRCPHCGGGLAVVAAGAGQAGAAPAGPAGPVVVGCAAGHRFDVARQGYLPLLGGRSRTDTGDDAAMVAARADFLSGGWYRPIADVVARAAGGRGGATVPGGPTGVPVAVTGPVVEVGAGTGYYLSAACSDHGDPGREPGATMGSPVAGEVSVGRPGLAIDASRYALRRAARVPGVAAVLADAWSALPVVDGAAAVVLSVFAPRKPAELARITAPGGRIVVVTPEAEHLAELRGPLPLLAVDAGKAQRVAGAFVGLPVTAVDVEAVRYPLGLTRAAAADLVAMGPTARHLEPEALARAVAGLDEPVPVTVSVTVTTMRRDG